MGLCVAGKEEMECGREVSSVAVLGLGFFRNKIEPRPTHGAMIHKPRTSTF